MKCENGSLSAVMSGKHYNRALRIDTCFVEALDRLLLKAVICNKPSAENKWLELKISILKSKDFVSMKQLTACPIFWELSSEVEQMKLQIKSRETWQDCTILVALLRQCLVYTSVTLGIERK